MHEPIDDWSEFRPLVQRGCFRAGGGNDASHRICNSDGSFCAAEGLFTILATFPEQTMMLQVEEVAVHDVQQGVPLSGPRTVRRAPTIFRICNGTTPPPTQLLPDKK